EVEFRLVFGAPSQKFKILAIPNVLANGKKYERGFVKKCDGHKLCTKSRAKSCFDQFFMHRLKFKILAIPNVLAHARKIKILAIPNVLAHENSYEKGFVKKLNGHAMSRAISSINWFSFTITEIQHTGHSQCISPWKVVLARFC
ncbi:hypothetical protein BHM03_00037858, partial [Ensete ventricosum]